MPDTPTNPTPEPLMVNTVTAARLCSVSRRRWQQLTGSGHAPRGVKLGRLRLWSTEELRAWVAAGCPPVSVWQVRQATKAAGERLGKLRREDAA